MMTLDIDALLEQEEVVLAPEGGTFDTAAIGQRISSIGPAWNDPVHPEVWLVFAVDDARQDRKNTPMSCCSRSGQPRSTPICSRAKRSFPRPAPCWNG